MMMTMPMTTMTMTMMTSSMVTMTTLMVTMTMVMMTMTMVMMTAATTGATMMGAQGVWDFWIYDLVKTLIKLIFNTFGEFR